MIVPNDPPTIHEAFHAQARRTPDAVCLVGPTEELSYAQVQLKVLRLASELRALGARPNQTVAVFLEASVHSVVALLAILTAGAAYVPLELAYPTKLLQRVLHDAAPVAIVTLTQQRVVLPQTDAAIVCLDDNEHDHDQSTTTTLDDLWNLYESWPAVSLDDLAFVVYSSGTTGQPKGIANPHRAPATSYQWRFTEISDYAVGDRVACHVFFVWEALRPVMRGGAVVPIASSIVFDGEALTKELERLQVTEMLFTPSLLENLWNTMDADVLRDRLKTLRTVFLNGEVVSMALRQRCYEVLPQVRYINLYSISECHEVGAVDLLEIDTSSTKFCPIGPPASPAFILDDNMKPVPDGEAGELYIGGAMLAIGYLNLPELTHTRFVMDHEHGRLYRTGDRARVLPNGFLEILGRCDFMVKIRGYSIVLGAVEAALLENVALSSCVVVADGEEGEDKHLVAYIVRAPTREGDRRLSEFSVDSRTGACREIRKAVDGAIPHYMIPSVFLEVESLPVNAVGAKLDRKALQAQSADRRAMLRSLQFSAETPGAAVQQPMRWKRLAKYLRVPVGSPKEDVEEAMASLWEVILDRESGSIGLDDDFHENGGHSLTSARLAALINKVFGVGLTAAELMRGGDVRLFSNKVLETWKSQRTDESVVPIQNSSVVAPVVTQKEDAHLVERVKAASILPDDARLNGPLKVASLAEAKEVFLTGGTGFLGAHVLVEVLHVHPSVTVTCLVRSSNKDAIKRNLDAYKLFDSKYDSRIVLLQGDLSKPRFGLTDGEWQALVNRTDAVIHCGASVSLTAPYDILEPTNVQGTLEAIRLACMARVPLLYSSSNGIFPTDSDELFPESDDIACLPGRLDAQDGYGLSKWAAERLVSEASRRGLPMLTIRFGNLGWHSETGCGNPFDYQGLLVNGCRRIGAYPAIEGWQFEVTPVDFAARAFVGLAGSAVHLKSGSIFNCVQTSTTESLDVFRWVSEVDGSSLASVPYEQWVSTIEERSIDDADLAALQAFLAGAPGGGSYLSSRAELDCTKFDSAVASLSLARPGNLEHYYQSFLVANRVLPRSMSWEIVSEPIQVDPTATGEPSGPLSNQVAVVTGASSGIGRAIVLALVQAGCHVAMGARRLNELEKTQKAVGEACPGSAVKTLCVKTDVTKREEVSKLVEAAERGLGPVDIIVNCAGVMYFTLMKNVVWDQWERQVDVNCKGTMYGIGSVLPGMLKRGKGHIVNITSDAGRKSFPGLGVYSGSKFFVEAMSQALRAETASTGLRVTCIQPGNVETPLLSTSTDLEGLSEYGTPTGAKVLEPADIGRAVVYALSQPEWCAVNEILVEPREEPA